MICNDVADIYQLLDEAKYNTTNFAGCGRRGGSTLRYLHKSLYHPEEESSYCLCSPSN